MRLNFRSLRSGLLAASLFLFCAVPGVFLFLFGSIFLAAVIVEPGHASRFPRLIYSLAASALGMALVLIGLRLWGRWMYALVFLALTGGLLLAWLAAPATGMEGAGLLGGASAFLVLSYVRSFYRKRRNG